MDGRCKRGGDCISLKLLVDMNLPPRFADMLVTESIESEHWHTVGAPDAIDTEIMRYALQHDFVVVTCDLDFSAILSATQGAKPSVIQVRARNIPWKNLADIVSKSAIKNAIELDNGAILTIDAKKSRLRLLPLINGNKTMEHLPDNNIS